MPIGTMLWWESIKNQQLCNNSYCEASSVLYLSSSSVILLVHLTQICIFWILQQKCVALLNDAGRRENCCCTISRVLRKWNFDWILMIVLTTDQSLRVFILLTHIPCCVWSHQTSTLAFLNQFACLVITIGYLLSSQSSSSANIFSFQWNHRPPQSNFRLHHMKLKFSIDEVDVSKSQNISIFRYFLGVIDFRLFGPFLHLVEMNEKVSEIILIVKWLATVKFSRSQTRQQSAYDVLMIETEPNRIKKWSHAVETWERSWERE